MKHPKILVGCPTSENQEYCLNEYSESVKNLNYPNYDILLVDNSKTDKYLKKLKQKGLPSIKGPWFEGAIDRIVTSRNIIRKKVLDEGYDYFFSLEQDVIPPRDVLTRLLKSKKNIISAVYFNIKNGVLIPLLAVNRGLPKLSYIPFELIEKSNKVIPVDFCGLGAVLIHRKILDKIKFRRDQKAAGFDDWWFCQDSKKEGFQIYADLSLKCKHLIKNRKWDWSQLKL